MPLMQSRLLNWTLFRELSAEPKRLHTCQNNCIAKLPSGAIVTILNTHGMAQTQPTRSGTGVSHGSDTKVAIFWDVTSHILKAEEARSSDTCVPVYQATRHNVPKHSSLDVPSHQNLIYLT